MQHRNTTSSAFPAKAIGFLLALTACIATAPVVRAQTATPGQITLPAASTRPLNVQTPSQVLEGTALQVSHYNPEQKLRLALAIQPPHMAEEEQFIRDLTTKGSPGFHQFLTQDEWNARFGPSVEDEQAVVDWAESQGLTVTHRYPNRLLVDVEGTSGTIEKAFNVTINNYQVGEEVDFSNDRDPVIPGHLAGILHAVLGLNNIERAYRVGTKKPTIKGADYVAGPAVSGSENSHHDGDATKAPASLAASGKNDGSASSPNPSDSYPLDYKSGTYAADPDNIQSSEGYDFNALQRLSHCCNETGNPGSSPPESSIALVGYGGFNTSDTSAFFRNYGMAWDINGYCIGGSPCPAVDGEAPLDVEYAGAMSNNYGAYQNTAHIFEYEMTNNLYTTYADTFNQIVTDNLAKVVSTSYGWEENVGFSGTQATGTMHPIFNNMVGTGWTLIAASGDSGASTGCGDATAVNYPASDPDFIAAGGTQLQLDVNGNYVSETGWQGEFGSGACGSNHGGSTGGRSVLFGAPSWQSSLVSPYYEWIGSQEYIVTGNTNRLVPDISLTANPDVMGEWYYSGGGWGDEGGTSIVAPELAGFFAQENSYLDFVGNKCGTGSSACSPIGQASPLFYLDFTLYAPHNPFYDMTSGCNDNDVTTADGLVYYCAGTGYDLVTGLGSANMLQLAWGINWWVIAAAGVPSVTFTAGPSPNAWYNSDQYVAWSVTDSGGSLPAPGVAGFTQGWDSIPSDPTSEPHGGDGNSFYSGPQYSFGTNGCLSFAGGYGCAGGSGQGCHTVHVQGWDNQGRTTTNSYGPVCYDSVAPTITVSNSPTEPGSGWWNQSVVVTLSPNDSGGNNASGIYRTYYAFDSGACYPGNLGGCNIYNGALTSSATGIHYMYYFTEDYAGNFSNEYYEYIDIDEGLPTTTASLSGTVVSGTTYSSDVGITLSATDDLSGVQTIYYRVNGGAITAYTGPFSDNVIGSHVLRYWSVDNAGNVGHQKVVDFTIESPTTAKLVASPSPSNYGQSVTMTATVNATLYGTPTGTVTFWNGATNLGMSALSGHTATLTTSSLPAGNLTLQASYSGDSNYIATNSPPFDLTVNQLAPIITWSTPAAITYGTTVSATQEDATANVPGTFVYNEPIGWKPKAGTKSIQVTFTPTDNVDYKTATKTVTLIVNQAAPVITWATPAPITYGTLVDTTQEDATANVPGTFVYNEPIGWKPKAGTKSIQVTFTPTDTTDYVTAKKTIILIVNQVVSVITWPAPAAITYGTALSATQLDATVNAAGTLGYTPAAGTVLALGVQTLSVTFTPTDSVDYTAPTATVTITVTQGTPVITWPTPAPITFGTLVSATQEDATANVPGTFVYSQPIGWRPIVGTHTLSVKFTPTDTTDYKTATASVTLTVNPAP
ncbi:MAG TPA: protease pro-enzyme activation domain-containing protein [Acidobacteriaceae bacterium]|jgi:hypothetical protein|nr:protease pro-enzyme activation domain-containing protein [Acidobacteriaceae bacterium]